MWLFTIWSVYICSLNVKRWSRLRENFYDAGGKMEMKKKIEERTKSGRCLKNYFRTHIYCFFIQYAETQLCFALITSATLKLLKVCFELPKSTKQHNIRLAFLYSHSAILIPVFNSAAVYHLLLFQGVATSRNIWGTDVCERRFLLQSADICFALIAFSIFSCSRIHPQKIGAIE